MLLTMLRKQNSHMYIAGDVDKWNALGNDFAIPRNIKHRVTKWPRICTPRCKPKGNESTCPTKKNCLWMFIAALFKIVKRWKKAKCP